MKLTKEIIWSNVQYTPFWVLVLVVLITVVSITGIALSENNGPELNSKSTVVYVLDTAHHHLGDDLKPELNPTEAEGTFYTKTFVLDKIDGSDGSITLSTKSVIPADTAGTGQFLDLVYVNGHKVGNLNDYIRAKEQDDLPRSVVIYFSTKLLFPGENNITISSGCNIDCSDYDDFEFYDLRLEISPERKYPYSEGVRPPLRQIWSTPIRGYWSTPQPVVSESGEVIYYTSFQADPEIPWGKHSISAINALNGEVIKSYESGGSFILQDHLVYNDGLVFASDPENIYAFGEDALEWKFDLKPYNDGNLTSVHPVVYDGTVYATINNARKILAIDARTGALNWTSSFELGEAPQDKEYMTSYGSTVSVVGMGTRALKHKRER